MESTLYLWQEKELEFKSDRNNCTGLVNFMKNCTELDAVDKWIDLRLSRLGQSYLSLRGQDDEETSFFCLAPISMTIESKDFLQRHPSMPFSSRIMLLWGEHAPGQVYVLAPTELQTAT